MEGPPFTLWKSFLHGQAALHHHHCTRVPTVGCCAWSAGLASTTLLALLALCVEVGVSRACLLRPFVAILLWSELAEGLSVDAIVLCVPLRPLERAPAEAQSLRLSAAVAAACGCVPRGQRAVLDADMNALTDRSSVWWRLFLPFPVLVQSAPSASSAASDRCSRISPSQSLVEGLVLPRCPFRESLCCCCTLAAFRNTLAQGAHHHTLYPCSCSLQSSSRTTCAFSLSTWWFRCDSGVLKLLGCVR